MIIFLFLLALTPAIIGAIYGAKIKGWFGEKKVSFILSWLDKGRYKVINDVVLDIQGKTFQIDHLIVSDFGVFVIETKNYTGWIMGGENAEYWTQVIFSYKNKFYNPIRQNLGHVQALKKCLHDFHGVQYNPIVVFSSKATIKVRTTKEVTYIYKLLAAIERHTWVNLTQNEKEQIFDRINQLNVVDKYDDRRKHVKSIKQNIKKREQSVRKMICPQCGKELMIRNGKFGKFIGCRSFPLCKFKANI